MNRINEVLELQGRSQTWLARELGYSYAIVNNYVNNKTQPSKEALRRVAKLLDINVKELLISKTLPEDATADEK